MERTFVPAAIAREAMERVLSHRDRFLKFLSSRVEDRATAEDILQSAYLKAIEHGSEIREDENAVAWFYRILRNAVIDHYRRRAARNTANEKFVSMIPESYEPEFEATVCACIDDVVDDLKPEYREAIEQIDLGDTLVGAFAESQQISANSASVRLHRARKALAKHLIAVYGACAEHKCLDCSCRRSEV